MDIMVLAILLHTRVPVFKEVFQVPASFICSEISLKTQIEFQVSRKRYDLHYSEVIMGAMASQITGLTMVYSAFYSGEDQRKHQSSASLAFVRGIHRSSVNSPYKWPVTRKIFPFDDVIMARESKNSPLFIYRIYQLIDLIHLQ